MPLTPYEENLQDENRKLRAELASVRSQLADLQASITTHFNEEHLSDDGREIDRLKRQLSAKEAELQATAERANREAQLACDLRGTQDEIIERCAKAVEEWPEAATRLRRHCGGEQDSEHAVSGEDFGEMRRQLAGAQHELAAANAKIAELQHYIQEDLTRFELGELEDTVKQQREKIEAAISACEENDAAGPFTAGLSRRILAILKESK